jgi:hypothetical protein
MLHVFYLDVAKVDFMLYMLQWDPHATYVGVPPSGRRCSCVRLQSRAGDVPAAWALRRHMKRREKKRAAGVGVRPGASSAVFL